jgi:methylthioribose-1-phosphate isomerase
MPTPVQLPTLLRESVIIENESVKILDRRVFPFEKTWVSCKTYEDVAVAIEDMVTQSGGPFYAALGGMVLAARQAAELPSRDEQLNLLDSAADRLLNSRKTNNGIRTAVALVKAAVGDSASDNRRIDQVVEDAVAQAESDNIKKNEAVGRYASALLEDGDTVLTHCWAEAVLIYTVKAALEQGKRLQFVCTETRPYLQGARLTSESLAEMGVPTKLITDGMPAELMSRGVIDKFITAADRVPMDGSVINKVGTLSNALAANYFNVPYYALVIAPDKEAPSSEDVHMEFRDGDEVLYLRGQRTGSERVEGIYPAFDITPPKVIDAIITDRGRFSAYDLWSYYTAEESQQRP